MERHQDRRLDLPADPASVGQARAFVAETLQTWYGDHHHSEHAPTVVDLRDTTLLLVSELATNAVVHARTSYAVVVSRTSAGVRVDVLDDSAQLPKPPAHDLVRLRGRGLALLDSFAASWGRTPSTDLRGFAKGVRFEVSAPGAGPRSGTRARRGAAAGS